MVTEEKERPRDSLAMALLAALGFITWGLWANWDYGWNTRLQVAMTQGFISLASTYYSAELVVWIVQRFHHQRFTVFKAALVSYLIIYALVWAGHLITGTPELLITILPGMITGLLFCFGYAYRVRSYLAFAQNSKN